MQGSYSSRTRVGEAHDTVQTPGKKISHSHFSNMFKTEASATDTGKLRIAANVARYSTCRAEVSNSGS